MNTLLMVLIFCSFCAGQALFLAPAEAAHNWRTMWAIVALVGACCIMWGRK